MQAKPRKKPKAIGKNKYPIQHWSHSSLMAFLRNPLAWHKRYVEQVYDMPSGPASVVGRAAHKALEYYYGLPARAGGVKDKEWATQLGLEYLRDVPDFEINFGKARTRVEKKKKREAMERDYLQAVGFYLARPPRYKVVAVEAKATVEVSGLPLPIKAVSDLVVVSRVDSHGLDVIDHKFVSSFTPQGGDKTLFVMQAIFNYYTVKKTFNKPVRRFIINELKISRNADGSPQLRRHVIDFRTFRREFIVFNRLIRDASFALEHMKVYLPNPSDMFEGENSFDIYRINLAFEESDNHFRPDE